MTATPALRPPQHQSLRGPDSGGDLLDLWDALPLGYGERGYARLAELGVDVRALALCGFPKAARVAVDGPWFALDPEGETMLIQPVYDGPIPSIYDPVEAPVLVDLAAYRSDAPETVHLLRGENGLVLGVDRADRAAALDEPLRVHRTPLAWLQAAGDGVCVLDWTHARDAFLGVPALLGEDPDHNAEILAHLTAPPPNIPAVGPLPDPETSR